MAAMKTLILLALAFGTVFATVLGNEDEAPLEGFSKEDMEQLKTVNAELLPPALKRTIIGEEKDNGTGHWCCRTDTVKPIITTKAEMKYTAKGSARKVYAHCGLWGWKRCTAYQTFYRAQGYYVLTYSKEIINVCPDEHVICCHGYFEISGHCVSLDKMKDNLELLKELRENGIVGGDNSIVGK